MSEFSPHPSEPRRVFVENYKIFSDDFSDDAGNPEYLNSVVHEWMLYTSEREAREPSGW